MTCKQNENSKTPLFESKDVTNPPVQKTSKLNRRKSKLGHSSASMTSNYIQATQVRSSLTVDKSTVFSFKKSLPLKPASRYRHKYASWYFNFKEQSNTKCQ